MNFTNYLEKFREYHSKIADSRIHVNNVLKIMKISYSYHTTRCLLSSQQLHFQLAIAIATLTKHTYVEFFSLSLQLGMHLLSLFHD